MILADKLQSLRTRAGLSQEDLAEKLNVSRQSISKWESGGSIPGIDKILELSKLYGVSTDYLLKEDQEELPGEVVADLYHPEEVLELSLETVTEYLAVTRRCAGRIALGVGLCILSPVPVLLMLSLYLGGLVFASEELAVGTGCVLLFLLIAAAVALFILNGLQLNEYEYLEKQVFRLAYGVEGIVEKEARAFRRSFGRGIALGVALCILSVAPISLAGAWETSDAVMTGLSALMLAMIALGVYGIVRVCICKGGYDRLLQRGDYTTDKKRENQRLRVFDRCYWCAVTAVYLAVSFCLWNWHISWIIWPVAGVAFAAIRAVVSAVTAR